LTSKKPKQGYKLVPSLFGKEEEIPEEWNYERIVDNSTLKGRIGWEGLTTAEYRQHGEFYLVTGTDFKDGIIDWENCVYVDEKRYSQDTNIQLEKGDVLVTKDGTIGKIACIDAPPLPATLNTGVYVIRPINKAYLPLFLFYILYSNYFTKFLSRLKGGSTINHLNQKDFINFHFPIPSYAEQQKIVSVLSNVGKLIQSYNKVIDSNKKLKKGLMQQLFTKGIGHKKSKKIKLGFKKIIEIPETWTVEKLGNIAKMIVPMRDKPKRFDGNIPWLRIEDLDGKYISDSKSNQRVSFSTVKEMNLKVFPIGTVLCSCSATIGECAITTKELITNQRFIGIFPDEKLDKEFLYYFLKTKKDDLIKIGTGGVHLYISRDFFEKFPITIPPINEQQKITSILSEVDSKIDDLESKKVHLELVKKGLMQELLSGQIRVKI